MKTTSKNIVNEVVTHLAAERRKKGFSHEKVASLTGLNRSAISLIEARKREPTFLTLLKISLALDCRLSDILRQAEEIIKNS